VVFYLLFIFLSFIFISFVFRFRDIGGRLGVDRGYIESLKGLTSLKALSWGVGGGVGGGGAGGLEGRWSAGRGRRAPTTG